MSAPGHPPPLALVVMGVSGSGKSTVAAALAQRLGAALVDGDDLHPAANVEKMRAGHPLTDEDRWPWLDDVGRWLAAHAQSPGGVTACSALRRSYRDRLRRWCPGLWGCGGDRPLKAFCLIRRAEWRSHGIAEHETVVGPQDARRAPVECLPVFLGAESRERRPAQMNLAAGASRLGFCEDQPGTPLPLQGAPHREGAGGEVNV